MSALKRKVRRLERHRAKVNTRTIPQAEGRGKADAREGKAVNLRTALVLKKKSGKNAAEFDAMDTAALKTELEDARKELFNLRFRHATGQLDRVSDLSAYRRRVARILTLIKQKEAGAES